MNPQQPPGGASPGDPRVPVPGQPPQAEPADIPESAFGFDDDTARPAPRPVQNTPAPAIAPAPTPPLPPQPAQNAPMPADVLPPQQVPPVPTLTPPQPGPAQPAAMPIATTAAAPAPQPADTPPSPFFARPLAAKKPFDPGTVPVTATSAPVNPITASYTPPPVTHLPEEIAKRITETPAQSSNEIAREIKRNDNVSRLKSLVSFLIFTASIFVAAFLINQFIFQSYYVEGTSMTPTLQNNDRLIISKVERTLSAVQGKPYVPDRGQIVVLDSSIVGLNGQKEQLIKRVIGLPGDHIHIENGTVTITNSQNPNGFDVNKQLGLTNLKDTYTDTPIDLTVPNSQVYVMGDNREQGGSYDSRAFGPIDGDKIQGRLWARILPLDKAQLF